eukprot:GHRR01002188.1.p1 GENE.GHRR01002188.1~~GHRR01002188.1.p1  ORF type:complete len:513 (+),score=225.29 GHRR01002188.1:455-1993(+)
MKTRAVATAVKEPATEIPATETISQQAQQYIEQYVQPLMDATLEVYKGPEQLFDQLVITPDLDQRMATDSALQWATQAVEAAISDAVNIAYHGAHSQSSQNGNGQDHVSSGSSMDTYNKSIALSDGMSGTLGGQIISERNLVITDIAGNSSTAAPHPECAEDADDCAVDFGSSTASSSNGQQQQQILPELVQQVEAITSELFAVTAAHTFVQRVLYKINRLNHFWYDDLHNYVNERSPWLGKIRDAIETPWQAWEMQQLAADNGHATADETVQAYQQLGQEAMKQALKERFSRDVDPPLSAFQQFIVNDMSPLGYCHLLAVGSLDGLVEASRQSRVCAGAANLVACTIFRVLMEEYGTGRYQRKHSTFYKTMMEQLGLNTKEESYLDLVPWQWLATGNQNFLLTERRRHYLRYAGALSFFEINGPSVYKTYLAAAQRNGLSEDACGYWALHIKEDERHGKQMLEEVALPLVDMYPQDAWEMVLGYDQDRFMGGRAGGALVKYIKSAEVASIK